MCTRYSLAKAQGRITSPRFGTTEFNFNPRYNIAPGQSSPVVLVENGKLVSREMKWGWTTPSGPLPAAPSEDALKYRIGIPTRRCLVPADGFYEWKDRKHPYRIVRPTRNLFWFAGVWDKEEFAILTSPATGFVEHIHDREPDMIPESQVDWWFTATAPAILAEDGIAAMGVSNVPLEAYPVTEQLTDPLFESPTCIDAVPVHKDPILHAIDDPDLQWRDISNPPARPQYATLLINDETTIEGRWDGRDWRHSGAPGARLLKWCPPTKFVHRFGTRG